MGRSRGSHDIKVLRLSDEGYNALRNVKEALKRVTELGVGLTCLNGFFTMHFHNA